MTAGDIGKAWETDPVGGAPTIVGWLQSESVQLPPYVPLTLWHLIGFEPFAHAGPESATLETKRGMTRAGITSNRIERKGRMHFPLECLGVVGAKHTLFKSRFRPQIAWARLSAAISDRGHD
jgi:hypothetical protein